MDKTSLAARALAAVRKGVLDRDQYMLTPKQRERYNQFRQQGIDDKVARQLAVAITKGGPGSGPNPGGGEKEALANVKDRVKQLREQGDHAAADNLRARVAQMAAQRAQAALKKAAWDESQHPRDAQGRFGSTGSGKEIKAGQRADNYEDFSSQDHQDAADHYYALGKKQRSEAKPFLDAIRLANQHQRSAKAAKDRAWTPAAVASKPAQAPAKREPNRFDGHEHAGAYNKGAKVGAAGAAYMGTKSISDRSISEMNMRARIEQAYEDGEHRDAAYYAGVYDGHLAGLVGAPTPRASRLAKKSYANHFVSSAKEVLPSIYFDQLRSKARAKAGGSASGMARRASADVDKAQLMERRSQLKDELAQVEAQLAKSAPPAQEVAVDAPVELAPKEKRRRKALAQSLAEEALATAKSCPAGKEVVPVSVSGAVFKSAPDWKRIVHSVVYAPGDVDAHGDYMDAEDIEKMAHDAMRSGLYVNHEHGPTAIEADIVESYIAPQDFNLELPSGDPYHIPKGAHVMAMHVWGDEPWQKILKGEYVGYSLEGTALRDVV